MKKYRIYLYQSLQNTLTYRGPIVIWALSNVVTTATLIAFWLSSSSNTIAGYTKADLAAYYVVGLFLQWLNGWMPFYWIKDQINDGSIVGSVLTKPVSFYWEVFAQEAGWHVVSVFVGMAAALIFFPLIGNHLINTFVLSSFTISLFAAVGTIFLIFSFSLCMGLLAFWLVHVNSIDSFFWVARSLLGGQGIPIAFFPPLLYKFISLLPFRYMFSFPLEIYFGKLTPTQQVYGFVLQVFWIGFFVLVYKLMWQKGRLNYTAYGN